MLIYPEMDKLALSLCHIAQWKSAGKYSRDVGSYPTVANIAQCPSVILMVALFPDVHVTNIKEIVHGSGHEH